MDICLIKGKSFKELTQYPHIFDCYWGNFEVECNDIPSLIIENRNNFVKEFNIKKLKYLPRYKQKLMGKTNIYDRNTNRFYDHTEVYYTNDKKYVLVSSPYKGRHDSTMNKSNEFYETNGFVKYKQLYCENAYTFVRIMD